MNALARPDHHIAKKAKHNSDIPQFEDNGNVNDNDNDNVNVKTQAQTQPGPSSLPIADHYARLQTYTPICSLQIAQIACLIGIVSSYTQTKPTAGKDMHKSLILLDPTASLPSTGLLVQFYRRTAFAMPVLEEGGVMILRSFKITEHRGSLQAWTNVSSDWTCFTAGVDPKVLHSSSPVRLPGDEDDGKGGNVVTEEEWVFIKRLSNWRHVQTFAPVNTHKKSDLPTSLMSTTHTMQSAAINRTNGINDASKMPIAETGARGRPLCILSKLEPNKFYDIHAWVVKTYPTDRNVTLYITDYTTNPLFHDYEYKPRSASSIPLGYGSVVYGSSYQGKWGQGGSGVGGEWKGPFGRYTMQLTLWDEHASRARDTIHENQFVALKNVRAKISNSGILEGAMNGDKQYPGRIAISVIDTAFDYGAGIIGPITRRKAIYEARFALEKQEIEDTLEIQNKEARLAELAPPVSTNPNIEISYPTIIITPVGDILRPPYELHLSQFSPKRYKTVGRIIDFWPSRLVDFMKPFCLGCQEVYSPSSSSSSSMTHTSSSHDDLKEVGKKWNAQKKERSCPRCGTQVDHERDIWTLSFVVLLEGQDGACLPLIFSGTDASTLLNDPGIISCDLRDPGNAVILTRLRERLFLFWGGLEERIWGQGREGDEEEEDDGLWVEVCLMEYFVDLGVVHKDGEGAGWGGRRFRGFGMRIC